MRQSFKAALAMITAAGIMLVSGCGTSSGAKSTQSTQSAQNTQSGTDTGEKLTEKAVLNDYITVDKSSFVNGTYIDQLKSFIARHYQEIIHFPVKRDCTVMYDEKENEAPITYTTETPVELYLSEPDDSYWACEVYELSHELCHYLISEYNSDRSHRVSWIEETICEALSVYFLGYLADNWDKTELYSVNPSFDESFRKYLNKNVVEKFEEKSQGMEYSLSTAAEGDLTVIEERSTSNREYRFAQMYELSQLLTPDNIEALIKYRDYANADRLLLDTESYRADYPDNKAVLYLCGICDGIKDRS